MSKHQLKLNLRRSTSFFAAMVLFVSSFTSAILPAMSAYADALNPLTDRSLTLSSSAPGWDFKDGSGNTTYAPPNSGANGQKTGNYYDFKVSTTEDIKTMSFQFCTTSAGICKGPGDNLCTTGSVATNDCVGRKTNSAALAAGDDTSDLHIVSSSTAEIQSSDYSTIMNTNGTIADVPGGDIAGTNGGTVPGNNVNGNYVVLKRTSDNSTPNNPADDTWAQSTGWVMTVLSNQDGTTATGNTGQNNYIVLTKTAGEPLTAGQEVKVLFFASDNDFYITNPGSGAFFVKINTYRIIYGGNRADYDSGLTGTFDVNDLAPDGDEGYIIDGGVTVANIMNHSIRIQTKVLETMQFSVGTVDPNMLASDDGTDDPDPQNDEQSTYEKAMGVGTHGATSHAPCDPIVGGMTTTDPVNVLSLGDPDAENSLSISESFFTHSFWRLSSNSSAGATVYYSGNTLSNTVGDEIEEIGVAKDAPHLGSEQFGLGIAVAAAPDLGTGDLSALRMYTTDYAKHTNEQGADDTASNPTGVHSSTTADVGSNDSWHTPRLYPLVPTTNYDSGSTTANQYAFQSDSTLIPVPIAAQNDQVVDCVTARMRYVANIAATTPAGIYTTAINYIAAPQY